MQEPIPGRLRNGDWKDDFVSYWEVEKGGLLDLNDLYMYVYQLFQKEALSNWSGDAKPEDFYLHRIRGDGVQENLIWWRATRKINPYCYYTLKMDWQNFGSKVTEVMYNDQKVKAHKIGITIRCWWWVQWDPFGKWEKTFMGKMQKWFYKYLLSTDMENHRDKCRELAKRMENEIKSFLEVTTSIPMPRTFFPEEGYKWKRPKPEAEQFADQPRKPDWQI